MHLYIYIYIYIYIIFFSFIFSAVICHWPTYNNFRCEKYIKSFMPRLTGAFLSMGLIMNFLSLNEMFLISLQGNPIFGVNLRNEEQPKLISCNWQFCNFFIVMSFFVFVNKHYKNHRLCGPLVLRCNDLSVVTTMCSCWLVWLVVGLESYSAGH